jgi:hypothetical protein
MKPVALDPRRSQFLGDRKDPRNLRQIGVKRGVETRCLTCRRKMLACETDDRKSRWNMQRRERTGRFKLAQNLIINKAMASEPGSTVHDPMPDGDRHRHLRVVQKPRDSNDRFPLAGNRRGLGEQRLTARILCNKFAFLIADRFGFSGKQNFSPGRSDTIQSEFERRRAAVQRENSQFLSSACHRAPGGKIELTGSSASRAPPAYPHHARRHRACDAPS